MTRRIVTKRELCHEIRTKSKASQRSEQRVTETRRRKSYGLQKLSYSRSWHQNIADCRREWDRHNRWDIERRDEGEKISKTGSDATCRNITVARGSRSRLRLGTKSTASWEAQDTPDTWTSLATVPENQTDDKSSSSSDSSFSSSPSTKAPSGIPKQGEHWSSS